jgi:hypothetical protein
MEPQIKFHNWKSREEVEASRFWHNKTHAAFLINGRLWLWSPTADRWMLY